MYMPCPLLPLAAFIFASGFEDADMIPPLICFMGNFTSHPCSSNPGEDFASLRDGFTALARLIDSYPKIKVNCSCLAHG